MPSGKRGATNISEIKLWERQQGESSKAFAAFAAYRGMGAKRSCIKVAQEFSKNPTVILRWSRQWHWQQRILAWDNECARIAKEESAIEIREMKQRHIQISMYLQNRAVNAINELMPRAVSASAIAAFLRLGVDLERITRGEPTERTESKTEDITIRNFLSNMTPDELREIIGITNNGLHGGNTADEEIG